jgi:hypothetical protein
MLRSRSLIAVVVTLLLLALLAGMAFAAGGSGGGHGYGYGYGYGYGPPPSGGWDPCASQVCRFPAAGRVTEEGTGAVLAGARVTLQRLQPGGAWHDVPTADVRPQQNPLDSDASGRIAWLVAGGPLDKVRVVVEREGYVTRTGEPRWLRADGALDIALTKVAAGGPGPAQPAGPGTPAQPVPPVSGAGTPATPKPTAKPAGKTGCAAKRTAKQRTACARAAQLAKALKACRTLKGAKRRTCERRARALSACATKHTAKQRSACRRKAAQIGRTPKARR